MKRFTLLLTCVAILAATVGCRCGGSVFNWRSSNEGCCGPVESISPAVTSYDPAISYDDSYVGPSVVSPVEALPPGRNN
ncbi:hypothetical protein C5Y97_08865 [Blastopirellula marina]|uniref:Membrane or secreted protein n=1 Tax=Blastopirellula marina TaxID=124 RepID=A0A2S8G145_9BACT|nr:hypothetical protein C5Y98_08860 [Blastopirellula marina]PTL44831.1 hypothetical protein C5Y97_08865 [Blastopirellula marina]